MEHALLRADRCSPGRSSAPAEGNGAFRGPVIRAVGASPSRPGLCHPASEATAPGPGPDVQAVGPPTEFEVAHRQSRIVRSQGEAPLTGPFRLVVVVVVLGGMGLTEPPMENGCAGTPAGRTGVGPSSWRLPSRRQATGVPVVSGSVARRRIAARARGWPMARAGATLGTKTSAVGSETASSSDLTMPTRIAASREPWEVDPCHAQRGDA